MKRSGLLVVLALLGFTAPLHPQESYLLVISGLGGGEEYSESFYQWSVALLDAASAAGVPDSHRIYLAEDPQRDPQRIQDRSSKENVEQVLTDLAAQTGAEDQVWIVLIGHGSYQGERTRFNLPGPDMTAEEFAQKLAAFRCRVAFVNTASSSGGFLPGVAGKNRVVVTATKSGFERNETVFGEYFAEAFSDQEGAADTNKDERISVLEGFDYARRRVVQFYEQENRLLTEHAVLDDNGDGEGSAEPAPHAEDGFLASRLFLAQATAAEGLQPELVALLAEKLKLEERIEELKLQKDSLSEELYLKELETLLLDLAMKNRAIRELEGEGEP